MKYRTSTAVMNWTSNKCKKWSRNTWVSRIPGPAVKITTRWKPFIKKLRYHFLCGIQVKWFNTAKCKSNLTRNEAWNIESSKQLSRLNCSYSLFLKMSTRTKCSNWDIRYPKTWIPSCRISKLRIFSSKSMDLVGIISHNFQ